MLLKEIILSVAMMLEPYDLATPPTMYSDDTSEWRTSGILGVTRCMPKLNACVVIINSCLKNDPALVRATVIHEYAHYVDFMTDGKMDNHKGQWRRIMHGWDQRASVRFRGNLPAACGKRSTTSMVK